MKSLTAFGHFSQATHEGFFSVTFSLLRVTLGVQFLLAGYVKFGGWSAEGALSHATGPFAEFYMSLAGNSLIDFLNVWGLTLIGLALILGLAVRPASFFGAILMMLYYFMDFEGNTAHGIIDSHIIYALIFLVFLAGGVGHMFGLNSLMSGFMKKQRVLGRILFG